MSLAEEARIIRKQEKKNPHCRESLYLHRIGVVRDASFIANIAYGFIRGKKLKDIMGQAVYPSDDLRYARGRKGIRLEEIKSHIERFGNEALWIPSHMKRGLELPPKDVYKALQLWIKESYPGTEFYLASDNKTIRIRFY